MKYRRKDAKAYAREHLRGIWAAALTPFTPELRLDYIGWRRNLRHWYRELGIAGLFVNGKQGEFYAMTTEERKRTAESAVAEKSGGVMVSCSDQSLDTVLELARHAQAIGADYIVVHTPLLYFGAHTPDTLYNYYRRIAEAVEIGVVLWNQPPDCGYLLEPEVCLRIAELPNVVAIKYSVPRETYVRLSRLAGERLIVSTSNEDEWLDNVAELDGLANGGALLDRLRSAISAYKIPRHILICEKSELPFTDSGKIQRRKLAELLAKSASEEGDGARAEPERGRDFSGTS